MIQFRKTFNRADEVLSLLRSIGLRPISRRRNRLHRRLQSDHSRTIGSRRSISNLVVVDSRRRRNRRDPRLGWSIVE